ncbi:hypothetical protein NOS3756_25290 [Nostoc sp. NIES-3756]|uniref:hypothetical protein n=1 Tax=Nostoc sp. NIES-3756 TaxID=1751286 RepID=UPI00071FF562|nr:hypothetical protein [Nostoc sp. NIES-3756]BAT53568.1 hypothetical protein NOS3756_25290 [Nostoc sp. NIES-3756]BAY38691.1 hypothetical protein NIES2111_30390 [Nostoc sp. NIES-2111]
MNPLPPEPNSQELKSESIKMVIMRFSAGALTGALIAAVYWSYADWFGTSQSLTINIIGSLTLALVCGFFTYKWGYKMIDILLSSLHLD